MWSSPEETATAHRLVRFALRDRASSRFVAAVRAASISPRDLADAVVSGVPDLSDRNPAPDGRGTGGPRYSCCCHRGLLPETCCNYPCNHEPSSLNLVHLRFWLRHPELLRSSSVYFTRQERACSAQDVSPTAIHLQRLLKDLRSHPQPA